MNLYWCLLTLPYLAGEARGQLAFFVDGYHGGVYGHYPDGYTRFIVDTLTRELLPTAVTPEGRTTVRLAIPRFGVRTLKVHDYSP